jgi:hypothetical protein
VYFDSSAAKYLSHIIIDRFHGLDLVTMVKRNHDNKLKVSCSLVVVMDTEENLHVI